MRRHRKITFKKVYAHLHQELQKDLDALKRLNLSEKPPGGQGKENTEGGNNHS